MEYTVIRGGTERANIMAMPNAGGNNFQKTLGYCGIGRYDAGFYAYIKGRKENSFTYEHDYLVQKVLSEVIGVVLFNGKNID